MSSNEFLLKPRNLKSVAEKITNFQNFLVIIVNFRFLLVMSKKKSAETTINVVPNAAGQGVREDLETECNARGMKFRSFVGKIYVYAVANSTQFSKPVKQPRQKDGKTIGATAPKEVGEELKKLAKDRGSSRGLYCNYILELVIEQKLFAKIFDS